MWSTEKGRGGILGDGRKRLCLCKSGSIMEGQAKGGGANGHHPEEGPGKQKVGEVRPLCLLKSGTEIFSIQMSPSSSRKYDTPYTLSWLPTQGGVVFGRTSTATASRRLMLLTSRVHSVWAVSMRLTITTIRP
jgi:hypothetical protein